MITSKALSGATVLSKKLVQRGMGLESIEGTPVELLSGNTHVVTDEANPELVDVTATADITSTSSGPIPSSHNLDFDATVEMGAKAVTKLLYVCRNVIVPAQQKIVEAVESALQGMVNTQILGFEVIEVKPNAVIQNGNFLEMVEAFSQGKMKGLTSELSIPKLGDKTGAEVVEFLSTGLKNVDEDIDLFVAEKGEAWFKQVWTDFFNNALDSDVRPFEEKLSYKTDTATAVFLIASHLHGKALDVEGYTLNEFKFLMQTIRNHSGWMLNQQLSILDKDVQAGVLVYGMKDGQVTVNGPVYQKWLSTGGDIDVLFGMAVKGTNLGLIPSIDARAEELKKAWVEYYNKSLGIMSQRKYGVIREVLKNQLVDAVSLDKVSSILTSAEVNKKINAALWSISDADLQNLHSAVLKLLCDVHFSDDHYFILNQIDFQCRENPNLTAREASTLVTIEYVTKWVMDQVKIVDLK